MIVIVHEKSYKTKKKRRKLIQSYKESGLLGNLTCWPRESSQ